MESDIKSSLYEALNCSDATKIFNSRIANPVGYYVPIDTGFDFEVTDGKMKRTVRVFVDMFMKYFGDYEGIFLQVYKSMGKTKIRTVEGFNLLCNAKKVAEMRKTEVICQS